MCRPVGPPGKRMQSIIIDREVGGRPRDVVSMLYQQVCSMNHTLCSSLDDKYTGMRSNIQVIVGRTAPGFLSLGRPYDGWAGAW